MMLHYIQFCDCLENENESSRRLRCNNRVNLIDFSMLRFIAENQ